MLVFRRSKFFISLASLTLSTLLGGLLIAQVNSAEEFPAPVFENLPSIDTDTLPIPPRDLPVLRKTDSSPSLIQNPYVDQFKQVDIGQQTSGLPKPKTTTSNNKNWRQALTGPDLELSQAEFKPSLAAPALPANQELGTRETIRVAKAEKVIPKLVAVPKLEPLNGLTGPISQSGATIQNPRYTVGEPELGNLGLVPPKFEPAFQIPAIPDSLRVQSTRVQDAVVPAEVQPVNPPVPGNRNDAWNPNAFWEATPQPSTTNPPIVNSQPVMNSQPAVIDQRAMINQTVVDSQPALTSQTAVTSQPAMINQTVINGLPALANQQAIPVVNDPLQFELSPQAVDASQQESLVWWKREIQNATIPGGTRQSVETNGLVFFMLQRSPRLRAVSQNPLIREQRIAEAQAEFDPVSFLRSQWQDRVDPVGDNLSITNDGTNFLDDHIWTSDMGIRRKTTTGATVELNQRLGFRNSNSAFFNPQDQGTAALSLNVTQPLMRGRGKYFNQSQVLIAQATTNASWDTLAIELQDEIQEVVDSYWRLYFDRCVYLQKERNVERAKGVLEKLEGRAELDSLPNQIARARSAVLSRKTELANARRDIRNSETDIRRLTADSDWAASQMVELLPTELPDLNIPLAGLEQVITTAINNRSEIREAVKRSKIAAIQRDISVNELMPELSLLLGTYVSALQGDSQLGDAFIDQFGGVTPGYSVGVEFEMPMRNRAARSRLTQRKLQMNLIKAEIEETLQNVIAESQIARRRVASAKETLVAATEAIRAARLDLEQNEGRWESFALIEGDIAEGQTPTIVLDQLLDSQTRLVEAEFVYTQAEMELKIAEIALQRTMGTLLTHESVNFSRGCKDNTPAVNFDVAR